MQKPQTASEVAANAQVLGELFHDQQPADNWKECRELFQMANVGWIINPEVVEVVENMAAVGIVPAWYATRLEQYMDELIACEELVLNESAADARDWNDCQRGESYSDR